MVTAEPSRESSSRASPELVVAPALKRLALAVARVAALLGAQTGCPASSHRSPTAGVPGALSPTSPLSTGSGSRGAGRRRRCVGNQSGCVTAPELFRAYRQKQGAAPATIHGTRRGDGTALPRSLSLRCERRNAGRERACCGRFSEATAASPEVPAVVLRGSHRRPIGESAAHGQVSVAGVARQAESRSGRSGRRR